MVTWIIYDACLMYLIVIHVIRVTHADLLIHGGFIKVHSNSYIS